MYMKEDAAEKLAIEVAKELVIANISNSPYLGTQAGAESLSSFFKTVYSGVSEAIKNSDFKRPDSTPVGFSK